MPPDQKKMLTELLTSQMKQIEARITALLLQKTQAAEAQANAREVTNTPEFQGTMKNHPESKAIDLYV